MIESRSQAASMSPSRGKELAVERNQGQREHLVAFGGMAGAIAASSCCIIPLALFSVGISGAWISTLTALAPYKPVFLAATAGLLGYGFYLVYWKAKRPCAKDADCARPIPSRFVRLALWCSTACAVAAFAFDYVAPLLLAA